MNDRATNTKIISSNIKRIRTDAGWSQADLAKNSGVSPAAISLIEKGERIPSLVVTRKLASALKVTEAEITGSVEQNSQEINKEAHAFFRDYGDLADLNEADKEIVLGLIKRFKEQENDKS
jgi:transcriptional regulator with XRE-family HTH domain